MPDLEPVSPPEVSYFQGTDGKITVHSEEPALSVTGDTLAEAFGQYKMVAKQYFDGKGQAVDLRHLKDPCA